MPLHGSQMRRRQFLPLIPAGLLAHQSKQPLIEPEGDAPYSIEKLIGNLAFAAALAWSKEGCLLVADLPAAKVLKVDDKGTTVFREQFPVSAMHEDGEGRMYFADPKEHKVLRMDKARAKTETVAASFAGKPFNGPSGLAVMKNGAAVWLADGAFATADREKAQPVYGVYSVVKGEVRLVAQTPGRPNGIALSPDQKSLYVVDSDSRSVMILDIDRQGAASTPLRPLIAKTRSGVPNGVLAAADGKLYVAGAEVEIYSAKGDYLSSIELAEKPADMVFGDGDGKTLYIAARTSVYRVRFRGGKSN
jgi:sugar lactone lactonase YvrE